MKIVTADIMKELEDRANQNGVSYESMMEQAGKSVADYIERMETGEEHALIFCGKGNNAGDALVTARYLSQRKYSVFVVFLLGSDLSPLAQKNLERLNRDVVHVYKEPINEEQLRYIMADTDVIIDGVFGTGFQSEILPKVCADTFRIVNESKAVKIAMDVPSGICADSGHVAADSFLADYTYSFAALKPAHVLKSSMNHCGKIKVTPIGIPEELMRSERSIQLFDAETAFEALPRRAEDSNKGTFGKLLTVGGSYTMSGSITLSNMAALRCGAGLIQTAVPKSILPVVASHLLEATYLPMDETVDGRISGNMAENILKESENKSAVLIGMGLGLCEDTIQLVQKLVEGCNVPLIIDGDGLNCLSKDIDILSHKRGEIILTPHMMEMCRLLGVSLEELKEHRFHYGREFAMKYNVTLVMKDSNTLVTTPKGQQTINDNGNSGMAKGGSGDVLAGMIASLVAQKIPVDKAASLGVYLHAHAGDLAARQSSEYAMLPHDMVQMLGQAFLDIQEY